jgi:hypothetical protein
VELIAGYQRAINRMNGETNCDPAHVFYGARNATQPTKPLPWMSLRYWFRKRVHVGALIHDGLHVDKDAATVGHLDGCITN